MTTSQRFDEKHFQDLLRPRRWKQFDIFYRCHWLAPLLWFLIAVPLHLVLVILFGGFQNTDNVMDLVEDPLYIPGAFAIMFGLYFYFHVPVLFGKKMKELIDRGVFIPEFTFDIPYRPQSVRLVLKFLPLIAAIVLISLYVGSRLFNIDGQTTWLEYSRVTLFFVSCTYSIGIFAIVFTISDIIGSLYVIHHIFAQNDVQVIPYHPDKSGGFSPLSRYSQTLSLFALAYGSYLIIGIIRGVINGTLASEFVLYPQIFTYLLIVPAIFYFPLIRARNDMLKYRDTQIKKWGSKHLELRNQLLLREQQDHEQFLKELAYLELLNKTLEEYKDYPVWPAKPSTQISVLFNAASPLITIIIGVVLDVMF